VDPNLEEEGAIISEVSLTPLIDVLLVLLIIFMVTSSAVNSKDTSGVDVQLPHADQAQHISDPDGVILTLVPGGGIRINQKAMPWNFQDPSAHSRVLERQVRQALAKTRSKLVVLEGDRKANLESLVAIMDAARRAGAQKFAIATEGK